MLLTVTYWYRCDSCADGHLSAKALARHHCANAEPGADQYGHCTLCGIRVQRGHTCEGLLAGAQNMTAHVFRSNGKLSVRITSAGGRLDLNERKLIAGQVKDARLNARCSRAASGELGRRPRRVEQYR